MKKIGLRLGSIVVYIGALLILLGIKVQMLFSLKLMVLIGLGTLVLFLPYYSKELRQKEIGDILGRKALEAGYIQTFILLFLCLSKQKSMDSLFENIALNCRPLLYGYCLYILLDNRKAYSIQEDEEQYEAKKYKDEENQIAEKQIKVEEVNQDKMLEPRVNLVQENHEVENTKQDLECIDRAEINEKFKTKGLTKREIEIAYAILKGMTNREIAETFYVSEANVKKHVSHIFEKLGIQKREEIRVVMDEQVSFSNR